MSKIKFGNFITYTGKYLSTAMSKAQSGNLVFARIINSPAEGDSNAEVTLNNIIVDGQPVAEKKVNNVGKDGYYIFGGKADGHLVTMDVFNALKAEVADLNTKVGDLSIGEGESKVTHKDVPAYVAAYVDSRLKALEAYNVKDVKVDNTSIAVDGVVTLGNAAQRDVAAEIATGASGLATAGQVFAAIDAIPEVVVAGSTGIAVAADGKTTYTVSVDETIATKDYVNTQVSKIDGVMEFKGTVTALPEVAEGSTEYNPGDVVVFNGEEYVLDKDYKWVEIGKVGVDDAVTSAKGSTYVSVAGNGKNDEKRGNITISVVTSAIKEGATGLATAADVYAAVKDAINNIPDATVTGATGYLKVDDDKNVVVDAAQVQLGATGTSTMLATKGYVDDEITEVSSEAAKHSSVTSTTPDYIGVTGVTATNGGVEYKVSLEDAALAAKNHKISEIKKELEDGSLETLTEATTVQGALQELFEGDKAASEGLNDLNKRLEAHIGSTKAHAAENITYAGATGITTTNVKDALDELYSKVDNIEVPVTGVTGDAASYSDVTTNKAGNVTVKNTLATAVGVTGVTGATAATATGLATDAWVKDYITSILAWEVLTD